MRNRFAIFAWIAVFVLAFPASGSVPKRVFVEHFGATW
jgi:hypothetical protein